MIQNVALALEFRVYLFTQSTESPEGKPPISSCHYSCAHLQFAAKLILRNNFTSRCPILPNPQIASCLTTNQKKPIKIEMQFSEHRHWVSLNPTTIVTTRIEDTESTETCHKQTKPWDIYFERSLLNPAFKVCCNACVLCCVVALL